MSERAEGAATRRRLVLLAGTALLIAAIAAAGITLLIRRDAPTAGASALASTHAERILFQAGRDRFETDASTQVIAAGDFVRITSRLRRAAAGGIPDGARMALPAPMTASLAGKPARVTVVARRSGEGGTSQFALAATSGKAGSGWFVFTPGAEFARHSMIYRMPPADEADDFIALWPDPTGRGGSLDVQSVTLEGLPADTGRR